MPHSPSPSSCTFNLNNLTNSKALQENQSHFWGVDPTILSSASTITNLTVGSGLDVYNNTLLPALLSAQSSIILVTCFWASSPSLTALSTTLLSLSTISLCRPVGTPPIRVRLYFSSHSLFQKLFHTSSTAGYVYPPSTWSAKLGLPNPSSLTGLDLEIKSLFFRPLSILHPKFVIVDNVRAFLPSCNLSWEPWLECCLELRGPVVSTLLTFYASIWDLSFAPPSQPASSSTHNTILLPSPYHLHPRFHPCTTFPPPPATPLNTLLLHHLSCAKHSITLVTPNLTSPPVLTTLLAALSRGINVSILTNRRMMLLEQLLTSGTITELCIYRLIRSYRHRLNHATSSTPSIVENADPPLGKLKISYFTPSATDRRTKRCHIKCTIVDDEVVVLGSGNMDRASWYTSLELGVAVYGRDVVVEVWGKIKGEVEGRVEECFGY